MKALTVTISFKNTSQEEVKLYKWLTEKSSYSGYLKDLLKREMKKEKSND